MLKSSNATELLAPAGSFEKLKYALEFGADAVYAGLPDFSLRARINKFDEKNIIEAINYTHCKNKKIYLTLNIFARNDHLKNMEKHLRNLKNNPPDALIISDPGVIEIAKKILPKVKIHLSTQANTTNWQTAKAWHKMGIERIVLARELSLEEIQEIHRRVPKLELEYFVHGAMCMAYSGRCFLSAWQTGRSSNLGDCAQNCRWKYQLVEEKRPNEYIPIEQDQHGSYFLNSKDLCLIEYLEELENAGITSFKIEGRAKSVYYLSQVVKAYQQALQIKPNTKNKKTEIKKLKKDLDKLLNRTFTTGFLFNECKNKGQETRFSHLKEKHLFIGEALESKRKIKKTGLNFRLVKIKVHNAIFVGDKIEFIQPKKDNIFCKIKNIYECETLEKLKSAHGGQERTVYIEVSKTPKKFSVLRKKLN
ncbi:MAG: U32 family peptidase C-terminal domain-containing protein [Patescibacteria group bacterium]|nr:U32 family peptidase C-terminal domain-containing protein [Patescibacteria group bacterium]